MESVPGSGEWYDEFAIGWNEIFDPDPGTKPLAYESAIPRVEVRVPAAPGSSGSKRAVSIFKHQGTTTMTSGPPTGDERRAYWAIARHKESSANIASASSLKRLATLHEIMGGGAGGAGGGGGSSGGGGNDSKDDTGSGKESGSASGSAAASQAGTVGSASGQRPLPSRPEALTGLSDSKAAGGEGGAGAPESRAASSAPVATPRAPVNAPSSTSSRAPRLGNTVVPAPPGGSPRAPVPPMPGRRPPTQEGRNAFWASEVLTSRKPPPYLRFGGGGAKESAIDLGIKEHLLQYPVSQLRKPAEVMEVELKQLRNELSASHNVKRTEARRRRRLARRCRVKQHEDLTQLEAEYLGSEYLEPLSDPTEKSEGPKTMTKDFFEELSHRRYTQAVHGLSAEMQPPDAPRPTVRSGSLLLRGSVGSPPRMTSKQGSFVRAGAPAGAPHTAR